MTMRHFQDHMDKLKRFGMPGKDEWTAFAITCFLIAFMLSFREWGGEQFDAALGFKNLAITLLLVVIALGIHVGVQIFTGMWIGFKIEYKIWTTGLLIGLVITVVSKGRLFFLAPGGIFLHHLATHRLGYFRYGINLWAQSMIVIWSLVATVIIATISKGLFSLTGSPLIYKFMMINLWLAIFTLLPLPPLDGSRLLFASRSFWVFAFITVVSWSILLLFTSFWITLFGSLLVATIATIIYYALFERMAWKWIY
ncbi:MAG: hypothetical protein Q8O89_08515 [Nanoarchaeota archaeon]|nr:hypothetical protein [Nanoarchaeota archaeon]